MLRCLKGEFRTQEFEIDIKGFTRKNHEREAFHSRWHEFINSDLTLEEVCFLEGDTLRYYSESFISPMVDARTPLLILLGNPAPHSVLSGICFAYEGKYKEHRFWKTLRELSILKFPSDNRLSDFETNREVIIEERRASLFNLDYNSPFRIGIDVFYSFPSPASDSRWGGVQGLRRLFGRSAVQLIIEEEKRRIVRTLESFMPGEGAILAFQKDAYERLRSVDSPKYSLDRAMNGQLLGRYKNRGEIRLFGAPPTRLMNGRKAREVLASYKKIAY